jgi:hypothetical protein
MAHFQDNRVFVCCVHMHTTYLSASHPVFLVGGPHKMDFLDDDDFRSLAVDGPPNENLQKALESFTQKRHGKILSKKIIPNTTPKIGGTRLVVTETGFVFLFPPKVWNGMDVQVNKYLNISDSHNPACWAANSDYTFTKMDVDKKIVPNFYTNTTRTLDWVEKLLHKNFVENPRAFPDPNGTGRHTIKHNLGVGDPNARVPFRIRMGGDFSFQMIDFE